jgi:hypothetical protein
MQATSQSHSTSREYTGQGEARHRKYMRLKFDGGQAYDRLKVIEIVLQPEQTFMEPICYIEPGLK